MNRTYALEQAMPQIVACAKASPPCEIVVVDYDSKDGLQEFLSTVDYDYLTVVKVSNREFYNSAIARNIGFKASHGKYVVQLSAEALPKEGFIQFLRDKNFTWACEGYLGRWIVCEREAFEASGGYDERFAVYAPEDKDICYRFHRRGYKFFEFSKDWVDEIPTPEKEKLKNYDLTGFDPRRWLKGEMKRAMQPLYEENLCQGVLIANEGKEWGVWDT
jgi:predicted glycosyltransferase involved in capsule biosynthesis